MAQPNFPKRQFEDLTISQLPAPKRHKLDQTPSGLIAKYTHPTEGRHRILRNYPDKSGLTPLNEGPFGTSEKANEWIFLEEYQRRRFAGMTFETDSKITYLAGKTDLTHFRL